MTTIDVAVRLAEIERVAHYDCELAHSLEDELFVDVLRDIANGHPDSFGLARKALESTQIDFARHCA